MSEWPDRRSLELLADVFKQTHDSLNGLNLKRYWIDNENDIELLEQLLSTRLLEQNDKLGTFRVGYLGLYFIKNPSRDTLLADINRVMECLRDHYRKTEDRPIKLTTLSTVLGLKRTRVESCVDYIHKAISLGVSTDLRGTKAYVTPSGHFLRLGKFERTLEASAKARFPDLFKSEVVKKPHGNSEANALKHEEVLGAAISVMANCPDECKHGDSFSGTKIAQVIDAKSALFWKKGDPPIAVSTMARLINEHLRKLKKNTRRDLKITRQKVD